MAELGREASVSSIQLLVKLNGSGIKTEWMTMARTAQESFDDEAVNVFMESPPKHIIASFKNAIDHFRAHPFPITDPK